LYNPTEAYGQGLFKLKLANVAILTNIRPRCSFTSKLIITSSHMLHFKHLQGRTLEGDVEDLPVVTITYEGVCVPVAIIAPPQPLQQ
jgi:hypothetical protein